MEYNVSAIIEYDPDIPANRASKFVISNSERYLAISGHDHEQENGIVRIRDRIENRDLEIQVEPNNTLIVNLFISKDERLCYIIAFQEGTVGLTIANLETMAIGDVQNIDVNFEFNHDNYFCNMIEKRNKTYFILQGYNNNNFQNNNIFLLFDTTGTILYRTQTTERINSYYITNEYNLYYREVRSTDIKVVNREIIYPEFYAERHRLADQYLGTDVATIVREF
jgi:hypothetical protein